MIRSEEYGWEEILLAKCVITMECGSVKMTMENMELTQSL